MGMEFRITIEDIKTALAPFGTRAKLITFLSFYRTQQTDTKKAHIFRYPQGKR